MSAVSTHKKPNRLERGANWMIAQFSRNHDLALRRKNIRVARDEMKEGQRSLKAAEKKALPTEEGEAKAAAIAEREKLKTTAESAETAFKESLKPEDINKTVNNAIFGDKANDAGILRRAMWKSLSVAGNLAQFVFRTPIDFAFGARIKPDSDNDIVVESRFTQAKDWFDRTFKKNENEASPPPAPDAIG